MQKKLKECFSITLKKVLIIFFMSLFMNGYSYADDPLYLFCVSVIEADNSNQKKYLKLVIY